MQWILQLNSDALLKMFSACCHYSLLITPCRLIELWCYDVGHYRQQNDVWCVVVGGNCRGSAGGGVGKKMVRMAENVMGVVEFILFCVKMMGVITPNVRGILPSITRVFWG